MQVTITSWLWPNVVAPMSNWKLQDNLLGRQSQIPKVDSNQLYLVQKLAYFVLCTSSPMCVEIWYSDLIAKPFVSLVHRGWGTNSLRREHTWGANAAKPPSRAPIFLSDIRFSSVFHSFYWSAFCSHLVFLITDAESFLQSTTRHPLEVWLYMIFSSLEF